MSRILAIVSLVSCLGVAPAGLSAQPLDGIKPTILCPSDVTPVPNEVVTYTVTLSSQAASAGSLSISTVSSGNFSSLPSSANYNAGDSSVVFSGTVASGASGFLQVSAYNACGSASSLLPVMVQTGGPGLDWVKF